MTMKSHLYLICAFLLVIVSPNVQAIGRCGCQCIYSIFQPPQTNYIGIVAVNSTNSSSCSDLLCRQRFTCSKGGGAVPSYSGDFGIFDGTWKLLPSLLNGCYQQCCTLRMTLTDRLLGPTRWIYEGDAEILGNCYGDRTPSISSVGGAGEPMMRFDLPIGSMVANYDSSGGRLVTKTSDDRISYLYCESGPCLNNLNVDTTGNGSPSPTSSASKVLSNAVSLALSTIVVVLILKR